MQIIYIYIYIYIFRAVHFPHVIYSQTLAVHHLNNYMSFTLFVHLYAMISITFLFLFLSERLIYIYIYIYCVGANWSHMFKLHWKGLGPISSFICTDYIRKGWTQYPVRGWESIRGRPVKEEMKVTLWKEVKNTYVRCNRVRGQRPPRNICPRWLVDLSVS